MTASPPKLKLIGLLLLSGALARAEFPILPPFQESPTGEHHRGQLIWADLFTTETAACESFYTRLFGWEAERLGSGRQSYTLFRKDGRPVAGMIYRPAEANATTRGVWIPYFSVGTLDAVLETAVREGGRIEAPARDFPERGRQAILRDPENALLGLMETTHGDPDDFLGGTSEWIWAQLWVRDPIATLDFYQRTLGVEETERPSGASGLADQLWAVDGIYRAGLGRIPDSMPEARPNWLGFIRVDDIDETLARVIGLGGRIRLEPRTDLRDGRLAVILDPAGAAVAVVEYTPSTEEQP